MHNYELLLELKTVVIFPYSCNSSKSLVKQKVQLKKNCTLKTHILYKILKSNILLLSIFSHLKLKILTVNIFCFCSNSDEILILIIL